MVILAQGDSGRVSGHGARLLDMRETTEDQVEILTPEHPDRDEVLGYWSNLYGTDALPWEDVMLCGSG